MVVEISWSQKMALSMVFWGGWHPCVAGSFVNYRTLYNVAVYVLCLIITRAHRHHYISSLGLNPILVSFPDCFHLFHATEDI